MDFDEFDAGMRQMGEGIRRAHAAFDLADQGFLQAMDGLKTITQQRGSLQSQFAELRETIAQLQTLVMTQSAELTAVRTELAAQTAELAALRARMNGEK